MNKKTILSLLLCLALGASLFALPAFAEDTVIVIGGSLGQSQTENIAGQSALNTVSAISNSGVVIFGSSGNAPVQSASSSGSFSGSAIVMPDGQVQQVAAQPVQQAQTQTAAQQGIQTSSAQTAAATTPTVVTPSQNAAPAASAAGASRFHTLSSLDLAAIPPPMDQTADFHGILLDRVIKHVSLDRHLSKLVPHRSGRAIEL